MKRIGKRVLLGCLFLGGVLFVNSSDASAATLFRLYNPNTGEHHYTLNGNERNHLTTVGWNYEGVAWETPESGIPVQRVFNPNNGGDHHYTINVNEVNMLKGVGWDYEGIAWQSGGELPIYRLYNPNAKTGTHHYTLDGNERDNLTRAGWRYEGIAFYAVDKNAQNPNPIPAAKKWTVWFTANSGYDQSVNIARGSRTFATYEEAVAFIDDYATKMTNKMIIGSYGTGSV